MLLPVLLASIYVMNSNKEKMYKKFDEDREKLTKNIALSMVKPLYEFSPTYGSLYLEIIKQDSRIVKIEVYDEIIESDFIVIHIPKRNKSSIYKSHKTIYKDKEKIGWVELSFSDYELQNELKETKKLLEKVAIFTFLALILIMYNLLSYKVLNPLKKLLKQTDDFEYERLEKEYIWDKNDEISSVGKSFTLARNSILKLIDKLTLKNKELEKLYITDRLTNLYNRHKLDLELEKEQNRNKRFGHIFGVIIFDIDNFKNINDTYGHLVGDLVLIEIAKLMKDSIRNTDILGRWGGEEFLIIVPETNKKDLLLLSEKIREIISSYKFKNVNTITVSSGSSVYKKDEDTKDLISRADKALYEAKKSGKNRVCFNYHI